VRVLVLGAAGMLGHKLLQQWSGVFELGATLRGPLEESAIRSLHLDVSFYTGVTVDDFRAVEKAIDHFKPATVVNCIGVVKQLREASDPVVSIAVNALFPHRVAKACHKRGVRLIHISTDCVFSGSKGPYSEGDVADADDLYGRTKRLGEVTVPGSCTLRTSIIGRELARGSGLIEWFLGQDGPRIQGYRRALYTGFTTLALADVLRQIIVEQSDLYGLWHVSSDAINKYDLINMVREVYGKEIGIDPYDNFACDRRLDSSRFRRETGFDPPTWRKMILAMHADPTEYDRLRQETA
jgi:dTDP-4-dehydrorhamnose reductase